MSDENQRLETMTTNMAVVAEYGWLIEDLNEPKWLTLKPAEALWTMVFTPDSLEAVRFARRSDAEDYVSCHLDDAPVRITEHSWSDPSAAHQAPVVAVPKIIGQAWRHKAELNGGEPGPWNFTHCYSPSIDTAHWYEVADICIAHPAPQEAVREKVARIIRELARKWAWRFQPRNPVWRAVGHLVRRRLPEPILAALRPSPDSAGNSEGGRS